MTFEFNTPYLEALLEATPPSTDLWDVFDSGERRDPEEIKKSRKEVGVRVQELRDILGCSREDFAKYSDRDAPYLQSVETGHWRLVPETATLIAMRTGVDAGSLGGCGKLVGWSGEAFTRDTFEEWHYYWKKFEGRPHEGKAIQAKKRLRERVDTLSEQGDIGWKVAGFLAAYLATPTPRWHKWHTWPGNQGPEYGWLEDRGASARSGSSPPADPWKIQLRRTAENLKVIRVRTRMTLKQLAAATGGTTTLGKIETSRVPLLAHVAARIGIRVGVDPASLIARDCPTEWGNYRDSPPDADPQSYDFRSFEKWEGMLEYGEVLPHWMDPLNEVHKKLEKIPWEAAWISQFLAAYCNTEPLRQWGRQSANRSRAKE